LSTSPWDSFETKALIGRAVRTSAINLRKNLGQAFFTRSERPIFYTIMKDRKSDAVEGKRAGLNYNTIYRSFIQKTRGLNATHTGVIWSSAGKVLQVSSMPSFYYGIHQKQNDANALIGEFLQTNGFFKAPITNELEAKVLTETSRA